MRSSRLLALVTTLVFADPAWAQAPGGTQDMGAVVESITGVKVTRQDRQVKISLPQTGLQVSLDGWSIIPPMGLSSWAAFAPTADGAVVMGDFVLKENEIGPVQKVALQSGLTVTGLHNHFVRENPRVTRTRRWCPPSLLPEPGTRG